VDRASHRGSAHGSGWMVMVLLLSLGAPVWNHALGVRYEERGRRKRSGQPCRLSFLLCRTTSRACRKGGHRRDLMPVMKRTPCMMCVSIDRLHGFTIGAYNDSGVVHAAGAAADQEEPAAPDLRQDCRHQGWHAENMFPHVPPKWTTPFARRNSRSARPPTTQRSERNRSAEASGVRSDRALGL
jgi:hypothetical protein